MGIRLKDNKPNMRKRQRTKVTDVAVNAAKLMWAYLGHVV